MEWELLGPLRGSQKSSQTYHGTSVQKSEVLFLLALTFYKWVLYFRCDVLIERLYSYPGYPGRRLPNWVRGGRGGDIFIDKLLNIAH